MVAIVVPELPQVRPLGLELLETKVIRVHAWGKKCGWEVGDVIVSINGVNVSTFEEVWQRIQVERDRPPVRFIAERHGADNIEVVPASTVVPPPKKAAVAQDPDATKQPNMEATPGPRAAGMAGSPQVAWPAPGTAAEVQNTIQMLMTNRAQQAEEDDSDSDDSIPPPAPQKPKVSGEDRFAKTFAKKPTLNELVNKNKSGLPERVQYVRDTWGRSVAKVTD